MNSSPDNKMYLLTGKCLKLYNIYSMFCFCILFCFVILQHNGIIGEVGLVSYLNVPKARILLLVDLETSYCNFPENMEKNIISKKKIFYFNRQL